MVNGLNKSILYVVAIFEVFTAMKIHVAVFWIVTPYSVVTGSRPQYGSAGLPLLTFYTLNKSRQIFKELNMNLI
jgi:hypothetical protein